MLRKRLGRKQKRQALAGSSVFVLLNYVIAFYFLLLTLPCPFSWLRPSEGVLPGPARSCRPGVGALVHDAGDHCDSLPPADSRARGCSRLAALGWGCTPRTRPLRGLPACRMLPQCLLAEPCHLSIGSSGRGVAERAVR